MEIVMILAIGGWTLAVLGWIGLWGALDQVAELRTRLNAR